MTSVLYVVGRTFWGFLFYDTEHMLTTHITVPLSVWIWWACNTCFFCGMKSKSYAFGNICPAFSNADIINILTVQPVIRLNYYRLFAHFELFYYNFLLMT